MIGYISINDINAALPAALPMLLKYGKRHTADSVANQRPVLEWPGVFITEYIRPTRNVLFDARRDANPFFHYMESLWIIAGQRDVRFLKILLPRMADYSDDGKTFHGAYGDRMRHWTGEPMGLGHMVDIDQIEKAIDILRDKPDSRQVVISIWDPSQDLGAVTKDMPCNDMVMLKTRDGKLRITVNNRSNDAILGCYGANAVQFSMLQMYMAAKLGVGVGTYTQVSDSFHVYEDDSYWQWFRATFQSREWNRHVSTHRDYDSIDDTNLFLEGIEHVDSDLINFFDSATADLVTLDVDQYRSLAARNAAVMWNVLMHYRRNDYTKADVLATTVPAHDWRMAAMRWLQRRTDRREQRA